MKKVFYVVLIFTIVEALNARVTCSQFKSWDEAQAYFDAKKPGYKNLDKDHDGEVCETMSHKKGRTEKYIIKIFNKNHMTGFGAQYNSHADCKKGARAFMKKNKKLVYKCVKESDL